MDHPKIDPNIALPHKPEPPESWECCGNECGDACVFEQYRRAKAQYDAEILSIKSKTSP